MKFRRKPTTVEANQFNNDAESYNLLNWINTTQYEQGRNFAEWTNNSLLIPTQGGVMKADVGDWIVKGHTEEAGWHFWPVKPDYFKENYEAV